MILDAIKITALPAAMAPLDPFAQIPAVQGGETFRFNANAFVLPDYPLLTTVNVGALNAGARVLTAGTGISFLDDGPGSTFTVTASSSGSIIVYNLTVQAVPAAEQDWNPTGWDQGNAISRLQMLPVVSAVVGGLTSAQAVDGQSIICLNDSPTETIQLNHEDVGSLAVNRFWLPGGADTIVIPFQMFELMYDGINNRWRVIL